VVVAVPVLVTVKTEFVPSVTGPLLAIENVTAGEDGVAGPMPNRDKRCYVKSSSNPLVRVRSFEAARTCLL